MHLRRIIATMLSTAALVGASLMLGNAQANAAACFANEGFDTYYFNESGTIRLADSVGASVQVNLTTRQYGTCTGGLPQAVDAAVAVYNLHGNVSAVDAHTIFLYADNGTPRTNSCFGCPDDGEVTRAFTYTPACSVSPFGSGSYFAFGEVRWRRLNGALVIKQLSSHLGPSRYSTIESVPCR